MVFSSATFVFLFLPVVVGLYYIAQERFRNCLLLAASLLFYAYGEHKLVLLMVVSIMVNYALARAVCVPKKKCVRRLLLCACAAFNLGLLFAFKYAGFFAYVLNRFFSLGIPAPHVRLPVGISFFTFQALSYVVDVYRGTVRPQRNAVDMALYISFFPQLVAGPIVRYSTVEGQLGHREFSWEQFSGGCRRFCTGFFKKVLLANNLAPLAELAFKPESLSSGSFLMLWAGAVAFSLQIFYDFAGYSDMAIGLAKLFGFEFEENFRYPYCASSVTDFWRRWHISLGRWFRDYVYIPLGGSRKGAPRQVLNLLVVWLLTGLWHGAGFTFIAWGLMYFVLLSAEKFLVRPWDRPLPVRIVWRAVTLLSVVLGWTLFNSPSLTGAVSRVAAMFAPCGRPVLGPDAVHAFREYGAFLFAGLLFSAPVAPRLSAALRGNGALAAKCAVYALLFVWSVSFIVTGSHNPFLYFNF